MNNDQMSILKAALERAAATLRGEQPSANDQVAARFGEMQPPSPMTPNQAVADRFGGMAPPSPMTPNQSVADRFGGMAPPSPQLTPNQQVANRFPDNGMPSWLTGAQAGVTPSSGFAPTPAAHAAVPMPHARPAAAPAPQQAMSWFQRNALMQKDPITGMFLDPAGAARAMRG